MTNRKITSTNSINKRTIALECDLMHALFVINGRWKLLIIGRLQNTTLRFTELKERMPGVTERVLILHLKELERDGIITRTIYPEVPPRVEYMLTSIGKKLIPVCDNLSKWGELHKKYLQEE